MKQLLAAAPTTIPTAYQTEERLGILELARSFAMREVLPVANELDPVQGEIPDTLRKQMADLGFFGVLPGEQAVEDRRVPDVRAHANGGDRHEAVYARVREGGELLAHDLLESRFYLSRAFAHSFTNSSCHCKIASSS